MFDALSIFWIALAVVALGVSKGGFGGAGTPVALPLMSLGLPPDLALGAMLPILMTMDAISVGAHRRDLHGSTIKSALMGAVPGVLVGALLVAFVNAKVIGGAVGVLAILFAVQSMAKLQPKTSDLPNWVGGALGALSGLTSTIAHAGGPPFHAYLISRSFEPKVFVATAATFMACVNLLKVGPYLAIGALNWDALTIALLALPLVVLSTLIGVRVARLISKPVFVKIVNVTLLAVGTKLIFDALS